VGQFSIPPQPEHRSVARFGAAGADWFFFFGGTVPKKREFFVTGGGGGGGEPFCGFAPRWGWDPVFSGMCFEGLF